MSPTQMEIAKLIDYALLPPTLTESDLVAGCELARRYGTANVTVKPCHVPRAVELLADSPVPVCSVISFPHGNSMPAIKAAETALALEQGAREVDMVCNIGAIKSGDWSLVLDDIRAVVEAATRHNALVKVILETAYLTDDEKIKVCRLSEQAGASFVKTSTGFGGGGATVEDVRLMRATVGPRLGVKASGGIRTLEDLLRMVEAGANRVGTSSLAAIMQQLNMK
ncbi:MAG: deoxyribose-phosphate aldolase [Chloroflexota bacterium]